MTQPNEPLAAPVQPAADVPAAAPAPVEAAPVAAAPAEAPSAAVEVAAPAAPAVPAQPEPIHIDEAGTKHYAPSADGLHVTECGVCLQVDDHPKHGFILDIKTGEETRRHLDCCAPGGCPLCARALVGSNGAKGHDLRAHIVAKAGN